jgi:hypothetical protein
MVGDNSKNIPFFMTFFQNLLYTYSQYALSFDVDDTKNVDMIPTRIDRYRTS